MDNTRNESIGKETAIADKFNWSRRPLGGSKVSQVFIATTTGQGRYGRDITKLELSRALYNHNIITDLQHRKYIRHSLLLTAAVLIPFAAIFYNIFMSVWR